ncbi:unnamed protein product [Mytilus edulis]|uniref:Uncharacterized protein n=1 Tax=Mytilus edulis TaxID=6550 RepID=A0A8S3QKP1_MYTED|nr:unnamed protein product [Mytilus edulis]
MSTSISPNVLAAIIEFLDDGDLLQAVEATDPTTTSNTAVVACIASLSEGQPLFNHRIEGFVHYDIPRYNDPTFKAHFRMTRSTFQGDNDLFVSARKTLVRRHSIEQHSGVSHRCDSCYKFLGTAEQKHGTCDAGDYADWHRRIGGKEGVE